MDYLYFLHLLSNLKDTMFNDLIMIRTETDEEMLKNYNKNQKEIWEKWQTKKNNNKKKKASYEDYVKAYGEAMKFI